VKEEVTVKQRITLTIAALALAVVVFLLVWLVKKPEDTPDGVLVYREAYMRMAEHPWQRERLCQKR